jgi:hypothetical protein
VAGLPGRARPAGTVADVIAGKEKPEFTLENTRTRMNRRRPRWTCRPDAAWEFPRWRACSSRATPRKTWNCPHRPPGTDADCCSARARYRSAVGLRRRAAPRPGGAPRPQHAGHLPGRPSGRLRRRRPAVTHTLCSAAATPLPKRPPGASTGHCSGQGNPPAGQAGAKPAPSHRRFRPRMLAVHRAVRRRRAPIPARPLPKHVQPHPGKPERKKR